MAKKAVVKAVRKTKASVAGKVVTAKQATKPGINGHKKAAFVAKAVMVVKPSAKSSAKPAAKPVVVGKSVSTPARSVLVTPKRRLVPMKPVPVLRPLVPLPPAPVTSASKPKKNLAGISPRELEDFRGLLFLKRRELLGDMSSMEREALQSGQGSNLSNLPMHMADMGTDNYEQEFTLGLVEKDRGLLREINHALAKIQDGTYGICEGTGKSIPTARLEIQPWAKFSIEWARQLEKNMMLRR